MRILLAIVVFTFIGGLAFEGPGAALGFLIGLVVGLIWYGRARERAQVDQPAVPAATSGADARPAAPPPSEVQILRMRLLAVEERLARLERAAGIEARIVPSMPPMPPQRGDADVAAPVAQPGFETSPATAAAGATAGMGTVVPAMLSEEGKARGGVA